MNFKFDDKDYDSEKLSDKGKIYLGRLQKNYSELLKKELPKEEVKTKFPKP